MCMAACAGPTLTLPLTRSLTAGPALWEGLQATLPAAACARGSPPYATNMTGCRSIWGVRVPPYMGLAAAQPKLSLKLGA